MYEYLVLLGNLEQPVLGYEVSDLTVAKFVADVMARCNTVSAHCDKCASLEADSLSALPVRANVAYVFARHILLAVFRDDYDK